MAGRGEYALQVAWSNRYTEGHSEELVGEFLQGRRDQFVLATKYSLNTGPGGLNAWGNNRKNMTRAVEASLKRLKTDYIDLYWVHIWDHTTAIDEVMRGLDDLVRAGKILYVGLSDTPAWVVSQANTLAQLKSWTPVAAIQVEYNLLEHRIEHELVAMSETHQLNILAWSPLAAGVLTGKYRMQNPDASRGQWATARLNERAEKIVSEVLAVAKEVNRSPAQIALNWVRQRNSLLIPLLGSRKLTQAQDCLGCLEFTLSADHMLHLSKVSAIEPSFPASMWANEQLVSTFVTGGTDQLVDGWTHRPRF